MRLTEDFELSEFDCHDGTPVPLALVPNVGALCKVVLQPVRDAWRAPIVVLSGYRTQAWNDRVGGARASTHLTAQGADVRPLQPRLLSAFVAEIERLIAAGQLPDLGGIGVYPGWVHLDIRKARDGHLRRWGGAGQGSER
jgi:uncharacterized protein YcbK (DUF882 family)